ERRGLELRRGRHREHPVPGLQVRLPGPLPVLDAPGRRVTPPHATPQRRPLSSGAAVALFGLTCPGSPGPTGMKNILIAAALPFPATTASAAPKWPKHPNLVAAWANLDKAWGKVSKAQEANGDQLGGHGAKAKDFIAAAQADLKQARDAANKNNTGGGTVTGGNDCPPALKVPKHANMAAASHLPRQGGPKTTARAP